VYAIANILPVCYNDAVKCRTMYGPYRPALYCSDSLRIHRKDGITMTENMKAFLERVSADEALAEKAKALDGIQDKKEAIAATIQLAEEAGCILTEADFVRPSSELSDDELDGVAGGIKDFCFFYGDNSLSCIFYGEDANGKIECVGFGT
jgi:predicted ribosomally synthesized peptide with nif11-like leader